MGQLKRSVLRCTVPGIQVRRTDRPPVPVSATAGAAIVAGVALYGIFRMVTSHASSRCEKEGSGFGLHGETGRRDIIQQTVSLLVPLAAPYIIGYIRRYRERTAKRFTFIKKTLLMPQRSAGKPKTAKKT